MAEQMETAVDLDELEERLAALSSPGSLVLFTGPEARWLAGRLRAASAVYSHALIAEIRARHAAAEDATADVGGMRCEDMRETLALEPGIRRLGPEVTEAVSHAPSDVPVLLAELDRLSRENAALREVAEHVSASFPRAGMIGWPSLSHAVFALRRALAGEMNPRDRETEEAANRVGGLLRELCSRRRGTDAPWGSS